MEKEFFEEYGIDGKSKMVKVVAKAGGMYGGMEKEFFVYKGALEIPIDKLKDNQIILGEDGDEFISGQDLYSFKVSASLSYIVEEKKEKKIVKSSNGSTIK